MRHDFLISYFCIKLLLVLNENENILIYLSVLLSLYSYLQFSSLFLFSVAQNFLDKELKITTKHKNAILITGKQIGI